MAPGSVSTENEALVSSYSRPETQSFASPPEAGHCRHALSTSFDIPAFRCTPSAQWWSYLGDIVTAVEFAALCMNVHQLESARIPDDGDHELFRLNCVPFSFVGRFTLWQPDKFVVCA
jgi:hypothetical protein